MKKANRRKKEDDKSDIVDETELERVAEEWVPSFAAARCGMARPSPHSTALISLGADLRRFESAAIELLRQGGFRIRTNEGIPYAMEDGSTLRTVIYDHGAAMRLVEQIESQNALPDDIRLAAFILRELPSFRALVAQGQLTPEFCVRFSALSARFPDSTSIRRILSDKKIATKITSSLAKERGSKGGKRRSFDKFLQQHIDETVDRLHKTTGRQPSRDSIWEYLTRNSSESRNANWEVDDDALTYSDQNTGKDKTIKRRSLDPYIRRSKKRLR